MSQLFKVYMQVAAFSDVLRQYLLQTSKYKTTYRVGQKKISGEVVDFNLAFFQFIWECNSENIVKIGPYLPKLLQEIFGAVFLAHPVQHPAAELCSPVKRWNMLAL